MRQKEKMYDFTQAKRGAVVRAAPNKTRITIRVDTDVLNWFREGCTRPVAATIRH